MLPKYSSPSLASQRAIRACELAVTQLIADELAYARSVLQVLCLSSADLSWLNLWCCTLLLVQSRAATLLKVLP